MYKYVLKRVAFLIPTILGVTFIIFAVMNITPGNPGLAILGPTVPQEDIDAYNHALGYDLPLLQKYFNYVKDTVAGFMALGGCEAAIGQEVNIATGVEHSIGDLANELIRQINPEAKIVCDSQRLRPKDSEVERLLGDATKMHKLTGWKPAYTFEQGLAATIEFLRGNMERYKPDVYNL